ncbi:hypothetical protein FGO68_gene2537 [Halteria grandinella]|uniref:Amidase domain-containing protein n=1 Tax=Halteria grandinella TaxID=5974 RepID=A0A8J8NTE4_HALGN|nr:hypothetical protein FGO68_gene2537 [Halteria grandinella]
MAAIKATIKQSLPITLTQAHTFAKEGSIKIQSLVEKSLHQIQSRENLNSFVNVRSQEELYREAEQSQERYDSGKPLSSIDGLPIAIKDNIFVKDMECTASSNILKGFRAPIDATVIKRLKAKGALIVGKTNMDEFGMGSLGMYGYDEKKIIKNPINEEYFAGGSSAGSAAAVRAEQALASLGTDTGGSVSYPAHCCGLYSLKPSYGRLSRFGQILYSSSNDVIGPMARTTDDLHSLFSIMEGEDVNDSNCINFQTISKIRNKERLSESRVEGSLKGVRVGIVQEFDIEELDGRNRNMQEELKKLLKDRGAELVDVSLPLVKYALPFYFTLVPSEASSNLSRYDGLKYGHQFDFNASQSSAQGKTKTELFDYIERVRSEAFGINVKRRVILGNFLLSSRFEDFNEKVIDAQKIRRLIIEEYCSVFEKGNIDMIISPVVIGERPPKISDVIGQSEKKNPVYEYKMDYYTAYPNATGTPAITIPVQEADQRYGEFPTSFKIQGCFGEDYHLLRIAKQIEKALKEAKMNFQ